MTTYSPFWLAGAPLTAPEWADRDRIATPAHPAEALSMDDWLRLPEQRRCAIVAEYAACRPRRLYAPKDEPLPPPPPGAPRRGRRPANAERDAAILALVERGVPAPAVAAQYRIDVSRVYVIVSVERRKRGAG